ncbi:MAG TPA: GIY-YIG nuclease family protein [Tepidisphaeraceae bacterium]|nr:GIY-YIG nuclease family protein [Tepidisphaeraceae bacterium]
MEGPKLLLPQVFPIGPSDQYKLHFGRWNGKAEPLDEWERDPRIWVKWQEYRPGRNDFNLPFIFSLINFYRETDTWLFGGVFEVTARHRDRYSVRLADQGTGFVGRLKLRYAYRERPTRVHFPEHYRKMEVSELLPEVHSGRGFPGYNQLDLSFVELETIVRRGRQDWRQPLELAKGIYLISDTSAGKRYVGSAYGDTGLWNRWASYVQTGHGGNAELRLLLRKAGLRYCRENFRVALLEHHASNVSDETIIAREVFWKNVLQTRGRDGLNRN